MSRGDLGSDDPTDLGYCLPVVAPCSLRMILSWRYNVLDGPSGFWSPDMLNTLNTCMAETSRSFRWFRLPFEDDHFIHHDHIPFCTVELNRMQLVSQVQPDILIHALFMQHNGKQKLNQIIHSIWGDTGEYNRFVFEVPGLCCFCCACLPAHPMTVTPSAWIEVGALIVSMSLRVCVIKPLSSPLRPSGSHHLVVPTLSWMGLIFFGVQLLMFTICVIPEVNWCYQTFGKFSNCSFTTCLQPESYSLNVWSLTGLVFFTCKSTLVLQSLQGLEIDHLYHGWITWDLGARPFFWWTKVDVRCYWGRIIYLDELSHARLSRLWAR